MPHFDLAIVGTGSGNSLVTPELEDKRVAVIDRGTFGGTCLNVGCIPTKMLVYAAEVADTVRGTARYGVDATLDRVRWTDIRDRVFGRIDPISEAGRDYRAHGDKTTFFAAAARFTGPRELTLDTGEQVTADQVVLAAGGHPVVPDVVADSGVPFHTSDTVMRIGELPQQLAIIGGGYIAAEFAHIMGGLGVQVSLLARGPRLLRHLDSDLSSRFTALAQDVWDVRLAADVVAVQRTGSGGVRLQLKHGDPVEADLLLVATGRAPNTEDLDLDAAGVVTHDDGRVKVDTFGRTSAEGVWALGDVASDYQLKHVANHEARIVAHNLAHPEDLREFDHRFVPSAIFTAPQIATVGLTEDRARERKVSYTAYTQSFGDTAYGWAREDTTGICKVLADPATGLLLGAHILGYQAANLIQPLVQAMSFGQRAQDVATGQYWIHPALMEVVENALLGLDLH